ncbi:MAG: class I SAM-dependent methyltransferase [Stenotrophomonas nitritireducens]|uniref:class I SAM-dependent methyltransferase n=1 Tax=Stenotrophomonas nitritireducens TaxID=83617 RepID=UPI001AD529EC|nr:class I SAM-dependent methyltransferase [Stenotrophomonas nitritireducens]MBN8795786.1 class I SAM-dependent methyltransferase [Stenotrophomonas nitritireducens]
MKTTAPLVAACLLFAALPVAAQEHAHAGHDHAAMHGAPASAPLQDAVSGDWRSAANAARDQYRHPLQTLEFFGVQPQQTVIEITPGGGWYSEILAPYLRGQGHYVAAVVDPQALPAGGGRDYQQRTRDGLEKKFAGAPALFDKTTVVAYDPAAPVLGKPGSADVVLTFRNVHNWRASNQAEGMFRAFFAVLRPGGTLGVVEHRAKADVPADDKSGYVGQAQVIAMAEAAGFKLEERSEINANPRDTKDHPNGVWTLPPSNTHDAADDARYKAIGESDRMTLRFVKPRP